MSGSAASRPVLILGGSAEARALAKRLTEAGLPVITSLAGRLAAPTLPEGGVRSGGFGGSDALARWLTEQKIVAVVDATHPFAVGIGASAVAACAWAGIPLLRVERPGWQEQSGDRWRRVGNLTEAASVLPSVGRRALLAIGRQGVGAFAGVSDVWFLVRCIEPPTGPLPPEHTLLLARGPFTVDGELALLTERLIDVIVTKDSGGDATDAKLEAARHLGLPVVMIDRPARPAAPKSVADPATAETWVRAVRRRSGATDHPAIPESAARRSR